MCCSLAAFAHQGDGLPINLEEMTREATLIFKGEVVGIEYRESEVLPALDAHGRPILDDDGQPAAQDGSGLPHTFIHYRIDTVYKGRALGRTFTLRMMGGVASEEFVQISEETGEEERGPIFVDISTMPKFDIGDRDILFVEGNTEEDCPLVRCEHGRFRLLPMERSGVTGVFNEDGHEIVLVTTASVAFARLFQYVDWGRYMPSEATLTHTILPGVVTETVNWVDPPDPDAEEDPDPNPDQPKGPQFTEAKFEQFIRVLVRKNKGPGGHTPEPSADPNRPFVGTLMQAVAPREPNERPKRLNRPWLNRLPKAEREAILRQEARELALLDENDGDPVLEPDPDQREN
jgi:hypothetical protein